MNTFVLINKPSGYTSRDIVNVISKRYNTKKVGHTGTLDPLATGLLLICIGKYTKLVDLLQCDTKEYEAQIILGVKTDTYDIEGKVIEDNNCNNILVEDIINVVNSFKKTYMQEVPIYSAVKVNGKKLYEYARNNIDVVLPKKEITIKNIEIISDIKLIDNKYYFSIKTTVSKGTYIRSLINDIGNTLGCGACMKSLIRTKLGNFKLDDSNNIDDNILKEYNINDIINYEKVIINDELLLKKVINGNKLNNIYNTDFIGYIYNNNLVALYKKIDNDYIKPVIIF